jgi:hypothetical protein
MTAIKRTAWNLAAVLFATAFAAGCGPQPIASEDPAATESELTAPKKYYLPKGRCEARPVYIGSSMCQWHCNFQSPDGTMPGIQNCVEETDPFPCQDETFLLDQVECVKQVSAPPYPYCEMVCRSGLFECHASGEWNPQYCIQVGQ